MTATTASDAQPVVLTTGADDRLLTERLAGWLADRPGGAVDDPAWLTTVRRAWPELPAGLITGVREFRRDSGPTGTMVIRGLPVGEESLPPTPSRPGSVQREPTLGPAVLTLIASGLGDPGAFRAEKSGAIVQDVVPVPGKEEDQSNAGSVRLSFHTENAFHPHRPDFVLLLCVRADHERVAELRTACVRQVLPLLTEESREALFSREFVTAPPPSFGAHSGSTEPHAVLYGAPDDPDLCVDLAATEPLTERARAATAELGRLFERTAQGVHLVPGDLAIVDNRVTVHGRSSFRPRYDGRDRWLQRTFVFTDLRRSRGYRLNDGHVLD
jgi:L-asparagine oxygenase